MKNVSDAQKKIEAARELLEISKRNIQLLDAQIAILQGGRVAVAPADDVSSEHRVAWLGATDDVDNSNGILIGSVDNIASAADSFGWNNPKRGTIRNQEDAAFVCTNVFVAIARTNDTGALSTSSTGFNMFFEDVVGRFERVVAPMLRLVDGNTRRNLVTGMTTGTLAAGQTSAPINNDLGAIPFSYFTSPRAGLGPNVRNKLFSEFTIPRGGVVKAEVYNLGLIGIRTDIIRVCVSLFGYKVYGG